VANWQNSSNSQILNYTQLSLCISLFSAYKFWLVIPTYSGFPDGVKTCSLDYERHDQGKEDELRAKGQDMMDLLPHN
jgi:hypothetical protein